MITNDGKLHIKRYLAGLSPRLVRSIAYGVGSGAVSAGSKRLDFEVGRVDIDLSSFDFINDRLVFKAEVPVSEQCMIHESAIFSSDASYVSGEYGSRLITTFDSLTENWIDSATGLAASYDATVNRIGIDAVKITLAQNETKTVSLPDLNIDMSGYSGVDQFKFAFNVTGTNVTGIKIRLMNDDSNYYEYQMGAQPAGYMIMSFDKSTGVITGSPQWSSINQIKVIATSGANAGTSTVILDGLRIEDTDSITTDFVMVARKVSSPAEYKEEGKTQEIEFSLGVSI